VVIGIGILNFFHHCEIGQKVSQQDCTELQTDMAKIIRKS